MFSKALKISPHNFFSENFKPRLVFQNKRGYLCARFRKQGIKIMFGLPGSRKAKLKFKFLSG